ncbi:MAG: hypothetical protein ACFB10_14355 [Salibacteraceae bacterium]
MTSFLIALVISICGISSTSANAMSDEALYNELYSEGYTHEQVQQEYQAQEQKEYADGSGFDLE